MSTLRSRAKELLPSVLLTLVSIVQALALELLWEKLTTRDALYRLDFPALLEWLQVASNFVGILVIWLIYATQVMRFRWVPSTWDSLFPFVAGVIEFTLMEMQGPERLHWWFVALGVIFGLMTLNGQHTMRRARLDAENSEFFSRVSPATLRDFLPAVATVFALMGMGLGIGVTGHRGVGAAVCILVALAVLVLQLRQLDFYWQRTMEIQTPQQDDPPSEH
jgi:hypothetical protein